MESSIQVIKEAFVTYSGMNPIWALYILSLVYILLLGKKEGRHFFLYPLLMLLCTVFNPFLVQTVLRLSGHQTRYHRVFWMIPFYMTIAYACVHAVSKIRGKALRNIAALALSVCIVVTGIPVFAGGEKIPDYKPAENAAFTTNDIRQLSNIYHSEGVKTPRLLYDQDLLLSYRCYDPDVTSYITRDYMQTLLILPEEEYLEKALGETRKLILRVYFYGDHFVDAATFAEALNNQHIDYVTFKKTSTMQDYLQGSPLTFAGESESYYVWRVR